MVASPTIVSRLFLLLLFAHALLTVLSLVPSPSFLRPVACQTKMTSTTANNDNIEKPFLSKVFFIECGFGNDSHGQSSTKAAVRACRNAIEFNSIPNVGQIIPGGYEEMKLDVILAVPPKYQSDLDLEACAKVFPYGQVKFTIQDGGMIAPSGVALEALGDKNEDMVIVCCSVSVGC